MKGAWQKLQLKRIAQIRNGATPSSSEPEFWDGDITWVTPDDLNSINGKEISDSRRKVTTLGYQNCGVSLAPANSVVLSTRAPIGHLAIATVPVTINQGCRILTPKDLDTTFLYYTLKHQVPYLQAMGQGTTFQELSSANLSRILIDVPPLDEQRAIAAFLDHKTTQIDALIDKKRRMIELLKEKRTALISHAVTKGLNPDAPMKDSGVPWLGQVPAHWEVKRLKFIFRNLNNIRSPLAAEERGARQGEYPYYGASGIIDYVDDYLFDTPLILVAEDGANLLSRSTPLAFIASGKYWVNNHAHIIKPICGNILYWESQLQVFDYTPLISGSAQPKLTRESLDDIWVAQPSSEEQDNIVKHMESQVTSIDSTSKQISKAILALREYRTAIISAAVTGQIDVRNHGAA